MFFFFFVFLSLKYLGFKKEKKVFFSFVFVFPRFRVELCQKLCCSPVFYFATGLVSVVFVDYNGK